MNSKRKTGLLQVLTALLFCAAVTLMPLQFFFDGGCGFAVRYPVRAEAAEGDYVLYTVQAGDSIYGIAAKHRVEMSQIIKLNGLKSSLIFAGQQLKVPTTASSGVFGGSVASSPVNSGSSPVPSELSMTLRDADLRDVLSALALKMDTSIFLVEQAGRVTLEINGVTPRAALELLLQKEGLSYLQKDGIIIVGSAEKLRKDFFNQMVLTRFNLRYISAGTLDSLIPSLGIPIQTIRVEANTQSLWAQGTPQAVSKLRELILAVDRPDNVDPDLLARPLQYRELSLHFITTDRAAKLLADAGMAPQNYLSLGNRLLVFDPELIDHWDEVLGLFKVMDSLGGRDYLILTYQLKNTYAQYVKNRIGNLNLADLTVVPLAEDSYSKLTRELLVVCPPQLESQVLAALSALDGPRQRIKAPLVSAETRSSLIAKRELLSELTGVPASRMQISGNLADSSNETLYLLWVEETPDMVETLREMVKKIDNP